MRACTHVRVRYVYTFTKLLDRRIPNVDVGVRVGVRPVEFQLNCYTPFIYYSTNSSEHSPTDLNRFHCDKILYGLYRHRRYSARHKICNVRGIGLLL